MLYSEICVNMIVDIEGVVIIELGILIVDVDLLFKLLDEDVYGFIISLEGDYYFIDFYFC